MQTWSKKQTNNVSPWPIGVKKLTCEPGSCGTIKVYYVIIIVYFRYFSSHTHSTYKVKFYGITPRYWLRVLNLKPHESKEIIRTTRLIP